MKVIRISGIALVGIIFFEMAFGQVILTSSNLPIVIIDTQGQEIPNEPKIPATMQIVANAPGVRNDVNGPYNDYDGQIGIEVRGSSSTLFEKKSYGIEIWDESNNDTTASILGMPKESDWVFHGPYSDKSLMRNFLAFRLGSELGRYASRTRFVELILNNNYQGVYLILEKIKRDKNRVDIAQLNEDENSGDDVTGGYIIKIDKFDGNSTGGGWTSPYRPPGFKNADQVIYFQYDYPKPRNITEPQMHYIQDYVTAFENALQLKPSADLVTGYKSFIDLNSFVDYAIINELSRNVDGYRLSTFLYKDKDSNDRKLYIGPIWDYNLGFGNADYYDASEIEGWAWDINFNSEAGNDYWLVPFWWQRFQSDREYVELLKNRWSELRNGPFGTGNIMFLIDSMATALDEAQARNFQRFNILNNYVWPNNFVGGSYAAEIDYLKSWISNRLSWLDQAINQIVTALPRNDLQAEILKVGPNPFSNEVSFKLAEPGSTFIIEIYNMLGDQMIGITADHKTDKGIFTWNGKDTSGNDLNPGIYILLIKDKDIIVEHKKIIKY